MIRDNISTIHEKIRRQAFQCGRSPDSVRLVAVSKRFPATSIREAMEAGQLIFGENYIQEAQQKHAELGEDVSFHFIGHLQSNKAKIAAQI